MTQTTHTDAAKAHTDAAKAHADTAALHGKSDAKGAVESAVKAKGLSDQAHHHSTQASAPAVHAAK